MPSENQSPQTENMSFEDKLALIEHEVRSLHAFCMNQGYNPREIERSAAPLLDGIQRSGRRKLAKRLGRLVAFVAFAIALFYYDPVYRFCCIHGKLTAVKLLPYWDWTELYNRDCLINNPYFIGNQISKEDCELCEDLNTGITRISNVSHSVVSEDYIKRERPLIVTDAIQDWPATKKFSVHFLQEMFSKDEALKSVLPCLFASNIKNKYGSSRLLLNKAARGEISQWYAHWENCDKGAAKVLRNFYKRPYFLPPMVETSEANWIFLSSDFQGMIYKVAPFDTPMLWFAQIKGQTKIKLTPKHPCNETCNILYDTVHEGEVLIVTELLWYFDYLPTGQGENIALAAGGTFD